MFDYHVHERHSGDAPSASVAGCIRAAEARGIDEIAFTTHLITAGPHIGVGIRVDDIDGYLKEIENAKKGTKVRLIAGLEADYSDDERTLERILNEHKLDFVLGSVHYIKEFDLGQRSDMEQFFSGRPTSAGADEYFRLWRRAIESGLFDVMAHPDYWRKYLHTFRSPATWSDYGDEVYAAIDALKENRVGFEVNTSGIRHGIGGFFPIHEFTVAARQAGVGTVTVGSDSHTPDTLGSGIAEAYRQLKQAGYREVSVFRRRKPSRVALP